MKLKGPSIILILLITIVLALGGYLYLQKQNKVNVPTSQKAIQSQAAYANTKQIADIIQNSVSHSGKVELYQPDDSPPNKQYNWKLTDADPFRTYNTSLPYLIDYFGQKVQITDQSFKNSAISKIIAAGYTQNNINTRPLEDSSTVVATYSRYGFTKNNERIVINISNKDYQVKNNKQINLPADSSSIEITCGIANKEFDDFYDNVIKNSPKLTQNSILNIWDMMDHAARLDVSSYPGGFGSPQYWIKKGADWQKVYEGQDWPTMQLV
ncbi:MAG: hypothetical protein WD988_01295 [Candidatus Curtissbacteria bacterium]